VVIIQREMPPTRLQLSGRCDLRAARLASAAIVFCNSHSVGVPSRLFAKLMSVVSTDKLADGEPQLCVRPVVFLLFGL
jgi:hypothetical protein